MIQLLVGAVLGRAAHRGYLSLLAAAPAGILQLHQRQRPKQAVEAPAVALLVQLQLERGCWRQR